MSKTVLVFDHQTGELVQMPLDPGGFLVICEPPMKLAERTDSADGTVVLTMRLTPTIPPSAEGAKFLHGDGTSE
jgi:hypothetical protein